MHRAHNFGVSFACSAVSGLAPDNMLRACTERHHDDGERWRHNELCAPQKQANSGLEPRSAGEPAGWGRRRAVPTRYDIGRLKLAKLADSATPYTDTIQHDRKAQSNPTKRGATRNNCGRRVCFTP